MPTWIHEISLRIILIIYYIHCQLTFHVDWPVSLKFIKLVKFNSCLYNTFYPNPVTAQKTSFTLSILLVSVNKSAENSGFVYVHYKIVFNCHFLVFVKFLIYNVFYDFRKKIQFQPETKIDEINVMRSTKFENDFMTIMYDGIFDSLNYAMIGGLWRLDSSSPIHNRLNLGFTGLNSFLANVVTLHQRKYWKIKGFLVFSVAIKIMI